MNKIYILILTYFFVVPVNSHFYVEKPYIKIADKLIDRVSAKLSKKHNIRFCGAKRGMFNCVTLIGLDFQINRITNKQIARNMVLDCAQELLQEINQDEEIREYLQVYPFDYNHIEITFYISSFNYGSLFYPNLCSVYTLNDKITYNTKDPKNKYKYKTQEIESFDEAVKIVEAQKKVSE